MDCTRCQLLLDDPARGLAEAEAQASLDPCCEESVALARLELGLRRMAADVPAPSPALDEAILKAASRRFAPPVAVDRAPLADEPTRSFAGRLRRWVTAPQVAMAMITSLAVVIGVVYVPSNRLDMEVAGDTIVAEPTVEAAPTQAVAQAPMPTEAPSELPPKPTVVGRTTNAPEPRRADDPMGALLGGSSQGAARGGSGASASAGESAAPSGFMAQAAPRTALRDVVDARDEAASAYADALQEERAVTAPTPAPAAAPAPAAPYSTRRAESESAPTERMRTTEAYAGGGSRAPSASPTAAAPPPAPAGPSSTDALLAEARAARARGACASAVPLYDRYLAEASAGPRAEATLELAGCLAATGRTDRARIVYQRATTMPQVASRARQELAVLESRSAAPRAARASSDTAREPAAEAAAAAH